MKVGWRTGNGMFKEVAFGRVVIRRDRMQVSGKSAMGMKNLTELSTVPDRYLALETLL